MKNISFALVVGIAILIVGFLMVSINGNKMLTNQQTSVNEKIAVIESPSDLDKVSTNLDNTDLDSMDNDLSQLNSDSNF